MADRLGSVVGASAGVATLAIAARPARAGRDQPTPALHDAARRWSLAAIGLAVVALAAGGLRLSGAPLPWNAWPVSVTALVGGIAAGVVHLLLRRRRQLVRDTGIRALLARQKDRAGTHRYQFFDGQTPTWPTIYVEQHGQRPDSDEVLTVEEMLQRSNDVLVLAGPGMGKSMMVAHIVWRQCQWWSQATLGRRPADAPFGPAVAVAIPAVRLVDRGLHEALADLHVSAGGPDTARMRQPPVPGARWLVLIDGVDEVLSVHQRSELLQKLAIWLGERDPAYRLVITTRALSFGELAEIRALGVDEYQLRRFDARDLRNFATKWFTNRSLTGPVEASVELFLHRVTVAGLDAVVEIPLMATIAALVFESDRDSPLPPSRAGLYAAFVRHLLHGRPALVDQRRSVRKDFQRYGEAGARLGSWIDDNLETMLEALADASLTGSGVPVGDLLQDWVRDHAPADALGRVPGWLPQIRMLLGSTGLVYRRDGGLEFIHRSLAEYLAAGPRGQRFDVDAWFGDMRSPDTRGAALFVLARSAQDPDPLVERLLGGLDDDLVAAGFVLADGIKVATPLRQRTVAALVDRLVAQAPVAAQALRLLADLAADPAVVAVLTGIVDDDTASPWVRVLTADVLDRLNPTDPGRLDRLSRIRTLDAAARQWARQRLSVQEREEPGDPPEEVLPATEVTGLVAHAYREALIEGRGDARFRLQGALALADRGDPTGAAVLREVVVDASLGAALRLPAARALLRVGGEAQRQQLRTLAADAVIAVPVRTAIAAALAEAGDGLGFTVVEELRQAGLVTADDELVRETLGRRRTMPSVWDAPQRNPVFVDRVSILTEIRRYFGEAHGPVTLTGLGGVGKTQAAVEYVYRHLGEYDIVWWVPAEQVSIVRYSLAELARKLGIEPEDSINQALTDLATTLRTGRVGRWLLVFDNADNPANLQPFLALPGGDCLVTSRGRQQWEQVTTIVEVDTLDRDEGAAMLTARVPGLTQVEAETIADRLGNLPLALAQAASWLSETAMPASQYLELLDTQLVRLLQENPPVGYERTTATTWLLSFAQLEEQSPAALQVLRLCAFFAAEPIAISLLARGRDVDLAPDLLRTLDGELALRQAIRAIGRYALARVDSAQDTLTVHRLIAATLRGTLEAAEADRYRRAVHEILAAATPDGGYDRGDFNEIRTQIAPHVVPTDLVHGATTRIRHVVLDQIGFLRHTGDVASARELAEAAVAAWRTDLGPDHPETLAAEQFLRTDQP
jgi:hypothetical protein